jgi:ABC-type multidrug transport system ATPase subunit
MPPNACIEIRNFAAQSAAISLRIENLTVRRGTFCALVAKSGAGKSVLLSVLTGHLLGPWMREKGAVCFDQFRVGKKLLTQSTFSSPARLHVAMRDENLIYLPQKFPEDRSMQRRCLSEMADVVNAIALNCPRARVVELLLENCRNFGLENVLEQPLKDLSGGERKRVEIIARLTGVKLREREAGPEEVIFLLDEPTTGLDNATQREYFLFLKETRKQFTDIDITFVIATHALSLLDDQDEAAGEGIFDSVLYVRKDDDANGAKHCRLAYCGGVEEFLKSEFFTELNGKKWTGPFLASSVSTSGSASAAGVVAYGGTSDGKGRFKVLIPAFGGELRRAYGKQFEGKSKRAVFAIPFLVGLIVFAAFLARNNSNPERFIFFSTIYAFWIGIFNSCQTVNGAVASGEWNYWVLAMRRSFFSYILANTLVSFFLSVLQVVVFAGAIFLFTAVWPADSLFNVFVVRSQLSRYFLVEVAGLPTHAIIFVLFSSSLLMGALAGGGVGTLISCVAKDTLGALKIAVGIVVVSMVSSSTVLKSASSALPVAPPVYLKLVSPAPFLSSPATLSSKSDNAGFCPHLLEDVSLILPQRYFFNIGRVLDMDVLEAVDPHHYKNEDFEYKLTDALAENWQNWKSVRSKEQMSETRADLAAENKALNEREFLQMLLTIIGLEMLACSFLSASFFLGGTWITYKTKSNYEIH